MIIGWDVRGRRKVCCWEKKLQKSEVFPEDEGYLFFDNMLV